jgi:hypothetical protein
MRIVAEIMLPPTFVGAVLKIEDFAGRPRERESVCQTSISCLPS